MNPKELYEKQYGEKKLVTAASFPFLRKRFKKFDIGREDIVLNLISETGGRILDVGSGSGSLIFKARDRFEELFGIDISPSRIKKARDLAGQKFPDDKKIHFSVQDISKGLSFPDEMFNVITCVAVLEHIFDPYFVLDEIYRILKPQGILILEVPNIAYLKYRLQLLFGKLPITSSPFIWKEIGWDGGHLHYFTKKRLLRALKECGFEISKITGAGLFAGLRNFWPSLLCGDIVIAAQKTKKQH